MSTDIITAVPREIKNPREIRRQGRIPAVIYGHGINQTLEIDSTDLDRLISSGAARGLLDLSIEGEKAPAKVMLKEIQRHPVRGDLLHVDFYRVSMTELITTSVPVRVSGEEEAVAAGAVVQHQMRQVDVQCLPGAIPSYLDVDLTGKGPGDSFTVGELEAPEGVTVTADPGMVIASLVIPREVEEEEPEVDEEVIPGEETPDEDDEEEAPQEG